VAQFSRFLFHLDQAVASFDVLIDQVFDQR
jgi:hypothetical protein